MVKLYDISLTVTPEMPVWPGDPPVGLARVRKIEDGTYANISRMNMGVHTGTHVDAPFHFIADGLTIEQLPVDALIGPATVVEFASEVDQISAALLNQAGIRPGVERVLFKTRNSQYWSEGRRAFQENYVALAPDAAEWLVQRGVRLVGIDYLSIAPYKDSVPVHHILLGARVIALEGIDLSRVPAGDYMLYCLPLKLGGCDGAPARAVLMQE